MIHFKTQLIILSLMLFSIHDGVFAVQSEIIEEEPTPELERLPFCKDKLKLCVKGNEEGLKLFKQLLTDFLKPENDESAKYLHDECCEMFFKYLNKSSVEDKSMTIQKYCKNYPGNLSENEIAEILNYISDYIMPKMDKFPLNESYIDLYKANQILNEVNKLNIEEEEIKNQLTEEELEEQQAIKNMAEQIEMEHIENNVLEILKKFNAFCFERIKLQENTLNFLAWCKTSCKHYKLFTL